MKTFQQIREGVYDPNIFKAVFLAGGPGSGKSFVVGKTLGGLGLKVINSDDPFERYLVKAGLSLKMPDEEQIERDVERARAKKVTKARQGHAVDGRLGIVIDGTGKDYDKITRQAALLQDLGYECSMVFVDTSLQTAQERNLKRARSVPPNLVKQSWNDVQKNKDRFARFFGRDFFIAQNNDLNDLRPVTKAIRRAIVRKVDNPVANSWIAAELQKKREAGLKNMS